MSSKSAAHLRELEAYLSRNTTCLRLEDHTWKLNLTFDIAYPFYSKGFSVQLFLFCLNTFVE